MNRTFNITLAAIIVIIMLPCVSFAKRTHEQIMKQANEEVNKVCMSMQPFLDKPDKLKGIKVEDTDEINAYADGKGQIVVFMGMVNLVQSPDELAMVCGHEEGHVSAQHIKRSLGNSILSTVVSVAVGGTAGDLAGGMIQSKQSRKHEREADRLGLLYAWRAGYDPYTAVDLWEGMTAVYGGGTTIDKYLGSHPIDNERVLNFKVLMTRYCKMGETSTYCDEILADPELQKIYDQNK